MKENLRKCIKCGSSSSQDASITLHRFPKPGRTNSLRCELWAKYCFPNEQWSSPEFQGKLFSQHKMLCSKHFKNTCFIDEKLFRTAVPSEEFDQGGADSCADAGDYCPVEEQRVDDICDDEDDDSHKLVESNVCRVCLALNVKMYDLKDIELREMFQNITGIVVTENDHSMLERLCWECAGRLKTAAAFRNKALLSDALLQGLANTGEQIRKNDVTLIKENQDYLKSAGTLSIVEVFHTVQIDAEYESAPCVSKNSDTDIVQKIVREDSIELKKCIIKEKKNQMDVENESMIEAPIGRIYAAYNSHPPGCSHVEPKTPISGYLVKTPSDCENKIKKTIVQIPKTDSISKLVLKKSKEVIHQDHTFKGAAKLKNINLRKGLISKKTYKNKKLVKKTQVTADTFTDEEYLSLESFEF